MALDGQKRVHPYLGHSTLVFAVHVCLLAEAAKAGITPNHKFLTNYLQGVESGNARAIARNAARGAQKVWQQHNTIYLHTAAQHG
jgi:hypothetical protein